MDNTTVDHFFEPASRDFILNPLPTWSRLRSDYPVARYEGWHSWLVSGNKRISRCLRDERLSNKFDLWEYAPPPKPKAEQTPFDELLSNALFSLNRDDHHRIRKLALPAFSPRVMAHMKKQFTQLVAQRFDEIGTPEEFNFATEVGEVVPMRAIASLVGIPRDREEIFDKLAYGVVRGINPMLTEEERQEATSGVGEGLDMLRDLIEERRGNLGEDFLSALITAESEGQRLTVMEMLALIGAVLGAGSDTAVDLHSYLTKNLLLHRDQLDMVLADRDLIQNAISEVLRYDSSGKTGLARYPVEDMEIDGHKIRRGQLVQMLLSTAGRDPEAYENPDQFDIMRSQENSISFGIGPHYCIGVTLVRAQTEVMFNTLFDRFPNLELTGEEEYDFSHHNARRLSKLMVRTNAAA